MKQHNICFEMSPLMGSLRNIVLSNLHVVTDDNIDFSAEVIRFLDKEGIKPLCEYEGDGMHYLIVTDKEASKIAGKLTECHAKRLNYFRPVNPEVEKACSDAYAEHLAKVRREWAADLRMVA